MSPVHATTIIARNYLPFARVLATSFRESHPDGTFAMLVLDDIDHRIESPGQGVVVVRPDDFLPARELHRMAMIYDVMELATAVKPFLLKHLLDNDWQHVIYLDPDIRVYAPLDDIAELAELHGIVLTPHTTQPMPRDARGPSEFHILSSGIYNLGFLGLGPQSEAFLDFWSDRLRRDCLCEHGAMMFTDQRWVDFVPGYFSHHILRDPTTNVAYWNADQRKVRWTGTAYEVEGRPLRFFHFSGFDPGHPYLLSKHQGTWPRILLSEHLDLARLCREYAQALLDAGWTSDPVLTPPYAYGSLPSGVRVDRRLRRVYRQALLDAESGRSREPPDPFSATGGAAFMEWARRPSHPSYCAGVSRYLEAVHQDRSDVRAHFPQLSGSSGERFVEWVRTTGRFEEAIPDDFVPVLPADPSPSASLVPMGHRSGVTVAGFFRAELGVGEAGRLLVATLDAAGVPTRTHTYTATNSRQDHFFVERVGGNTLSDVNILCLNADRIAGFRAEIGEDFFRDRYTVGLWAWETEDFPVSMHHGFDLVDEVWTLSSYSARVLRSYTSKPVHVFSLPVVVPQPDHGIADALLDDLSVSDRFTFIFLFDYFSVLERKNPLGLIEAFRRAFAPDEGPVLLVKTLNGDKNLLTQEVVRAAAAEYPDVFIIDRYLSAESRIGLIDRCDAYVSLHRAEGFGLTMAEAMALGKPVIATAYSGNLDFMTNENSLLVSHRMTQIPPGCDPYPSGGRWADPDLDEAARAMRLVFSEPRFAQEKGQQAHHDIVTKHSVASRVPFVLSRLADIRSMTEQTTANPVVNEHVALEPIDGFVAESLPSTGTVWEAPGAGPEEPVPVGPIHRAVGLVCDPPGGPGPSRYGRLGRLARAGVIRLMRPYWWRQRMLDQALVDVVQDERCRRELAEVRTAHVEREVSETQRRVGELAHDLGRVAESLVELARDTHCARDLSDGSIARVETNLEGIQRRVDEFSHALEKIAERAVATPPTVGGIDHPAEGLEVERGPLHVTGWAVNSAQPVSRVQIYVNGVQTPPARLGLPRPDLPMVFDAPEASIAGFETWIDLTALDNIGERASIEAVVGTTDGAETLLARREIAVAPMELRPQPLSFLRSRVTRVHRPVQPRLLIFSHDLQRGGAQLAMLDVLASIEQINTTVTSPADGPIRAQIEALGASVQLLSQPPLDHHDGYLRTVDDLVSHFAPGEYDAVIINTLVPFWGVEVARCLGLPVLWFVHEHSPLPIFWASRMADPRRLHPAVFSRAEAALSEADEVVLVSAVAERQYRSYRPNADFVVINNAIDVTDVTARLRQVQRSEVRARLGLDPDAPVVLCVGAIEPHKGQAVLAQAFPLFRTGHPDAQLVLAGALDGGYERGLRCYLGARRLADSVHILPFADDVVPWYAVADVAVNASDQEMQPGALLEAMACGVPVVGTDVGGVSELLTERRTGFLCEPSNVVSLAAAVDRALSASAGERAAMIKAARLQVLDHHDSRQRQAAYASVIRRLLHHPDSVRADA